MIRILVIDDEENIRLLLKEIFTMNGYITEEAVNGQEGVQMLKQSHYDLIFLDKRMPVMSGDETLKAIRSFTDTPVYLISAFQTHEEMESFLAMGATGMLNKPFAIGEVIEIAKKYDLQDS